MGRSSLKGPKRIAVLMLCLLLALSFSKPLFSYANSPNAMTVRIGWFESPYSQTDSLQRKTGLAYEYAQRIASYTGWNYEYVEGTWDELFDMLKKGEIDLLYDVSYTEERSSMFLYPQYPMGEESYYVYIRSDNTEISLEDMGSFNGKKFAVTKGTIQEQMLIEWAKRKGIFINVVEIKDDSVENTVKLLQNEVVDAFVAQDTYGGKEVCAPVTKIGSSSYYFAVSKSRHDLLRELNGALARIFDEDPYYNQKLYKKYIPSVNVSAFLTANEQRWIQKHGAIRVGYKEDYLPYCAVDENTGELTGALRDYLDIAADCMMNEKIDYVAVPYPDIEEAIGAMERGEIDCVFPIYLGPFDSERRGFMVTDSLMNSEMYLIVRKNDLTNISIEQDLTVAINEGNTSYAAFVTDYFNNWTIDLCDSVDKCFEAVADGTANGLLISSYRLYQSDSARNRYRLSMMATGQDMGFSFAIEKGNKELYSIMNRSVNLIGPQMADAVLGKYTVGERVTFIDFFRDNLIIVIIVIFVVCMIILFLVLEKLNADKRAEERLRLITATEFDSVTHLYNRNFFFEYADRMFKEQPDKKYDAVALNLDQFHTINAIGGWDFGDLVLQTMASEIEAYLEESDGLACRSQADRFNILCSSRDSYWDLFDRIQGKLNELSTNITLQLRMGVMHWQEGLRPVELFDRARTACNMVRGGHTSKLMVFNEDMRKKELRDHRLLTDLRRALEEHEFQIYYQPKYDVQTSTPYMCSAEALVRWKHKELGMISPGEFIPLFEQNCKIDLLDRYVWREVARQIAEWRDKYGVVVPVSVNLSRIDVFDPDLEQILDEIVNENGIDRSVFDLEVTESAYTDNADKVIEIVSGLRAKGHHIEMDDFGTGYSSLSMLSSLPIDVLKLDMAFIRKMDSNENDARMVELIIDIAKGLHVPVVAEGVEHEHQIEFLRSRGCEMVQGYYFSPPLPAEDFEAKYVAVFPQPLGQQNKTL